MSNLKAISIDGIVVEVDPLSQFMGGSYFMPVVAKYPEHAITKGFGYATLFPLARGLARVTPAPAGVRVDFLAATSPNSWGETRYADVTLTASGNITAFWSVELKAAPAGSAALAHALVLTIAKDAGSQHTQTLYKGPLDGLTRTDVGSSQPGVALPVRV